MADRLQRVLMIEDEQDIRLIARMALEKVGGLTVEICSSGSEALARGAGFQPDLILLDVMMPEMDGPSTLKELRKIQELSTVPVVFMTAKVQPHERERYLALGAVGVIAKPFAPMELPGLLREYWADHAVPGTPT
ncbi:MAG: response regulator [Acidobacteriota bacterium]|nr:response regulator [Acidobacteriota bacterium]